jgi:hypothetical protein
MTAQFHCAVGPGISFRTRSLERDAQTDTEWLAAGGVKGG